MHLKNSFYRLPFKFDTQRLKEELSLYNENEWRAHPSGFVGNSAMILISSNGGQNDDMQMPMLPTDRLQRAPYLQQVLASFNTVIGRSRLMRLAGQSTVKEHSDINYYWRKRVRIHIPIITHPDIRFHCDEEDVHMSEGESWVFDNWRRHKVINPTDITRVHLVADTVGTTEFWDMLRNPYKPVSDEKFIAYDANKKTPLILERYEQSGPMSPGEMEAELIALDTDVMSNSNNDRTGATLFSRRLTGFYQQWRSLWMLYGNQPENDSHYRSLIDNIINTINNENYHLHVASNGLSATEILFSTLSAAIPRRTSAKTPPGITPKATTPTTEGIAEFDQPVFIISAPRSGSTLLFELLANNRNFWTLGDEAHQLIESVSGLSPHDNNYESNRLDASDATPTVINGIRQRFSHQLRNHNQRRWDELPPQQRNHSIRFLEKTPKNALRIPFLRKAFPGAKFIFLHRQARDNISSLMDSWTSGRFITYRNLPNWSGLDWSHLLIPGWQKLIDSHIEEITAQQWQTTNQIILEDLQQLDATRWCSVSYENLLNDPAKELQRLCEFSGVPFGKRIQEIATQPMKNSRYTLTPPDPNKWQRHAEELKRVLPNIALTQQQLDSL